MRGGHNRTSARAKTLAGTARRDRRRPLLQVLDGKDTRAHGFHPPRWLKSVALAKWHQLSPTLARRGILTELTEDLLANACMHWEMMVRCYRRISRDGPIVKGYRGVITKHPAQQVFRENSAAFRECLARMGMTPIDVGKLDGLEQPDDEDDAFFHPHAAASRRLV